VSEMPDYFRYWGKAKKNGSRYHLLPYHCLDATAVAVVWQHQNVSINQVLKM